jgi:23S rRNA (uridine2552-2'-O)-methyltransferase
MALDISQQLLKAQGSALIKLLQGVGFEAFIATARRAYRTVKLLKPKASRSRSPETYLLASGRRMV